MQVKGLRFLDQNYFHLENNHILSDPHIITDLINLDKSVVGPIIKIKDQTWSNFWGALDENEFYKRSFDYLDIINNKKGGYGIYLI